MFDFPLELGTIKQSEAVSPENEFACPLSPSEWMYRIAEIDVDFNCI